MTIQKEIKMTTKIMLLALALCFIKTHAQSINIGSGANLVIGSGTYVETGGGVTMAGGTAAVDNSGMIKLAGDWTNNGSGLINANPGAVVFNGTGSQSIGGSAATTFNNLTVNNGSGVNNNVSLASNAVVAGTLAFTNGNIATGSSKVIVPSSGSISGASATTGWVNGNLEKDFTTDAGTQSFKYETGDAAIYAPATLAMKNVNVSAHPVNITGYIAAADANENVPTAGASNIDQSAKVNRYWFMSENSAAGSFDSYDITLDFTNTSNTGNTADYIVREFNTTTDNWASTSASVTGTTITATGLVNFGDFEVGNAGFITVNLNMFIQGYYLGGGKMSPLLHLLGGTAGAVDTVIVELDSASAPYNVAYTTTGILQSDGTLACKFPGAAKDNSFYISIKHRNSLETWSAGSLLLALSNSYDFTSGAGQAYGSNMIGLGDGKYGIYSGDITRDGSIDGSDKSSLKGTLPLFKIGSYDVHDINGDGIVDQSDYRLMQNNVPIGVSIQRP